MARLSGMNFFDPETVQNPELFYAAAREEAPVYMLPNSPIKGKRVYLVSTYDLVREAHKSPQIFSNRFAPFLRGDGEVLPEVKAIDDQGYATVNTLLTEDPPRHTRFRRMVSRAFNERRVHRMEDYIQQICDELIDGFENNGHCDFVREFAVPLPVFVIADQLGVPRSDMDTFKRWSDETIAGISQMKGKESLIRAARANLEIQNYMLKVIEKRRVQPADDVISDLVNMDDEEGGKLAIDEILSIIKQLLVAGNETATNTLISAAFHILSTPGLQDRIASEPGLSAKICEEVLRIEAPTKHMWRVVEENTRLGGVNLQAGDLLLLSYHSANHDPERYKDGNAFSLQREGPTSHLAFGGGIHFCVGAQVARSEIRIALQRLFSRLGNWKILTPPDRIRYIESVMHRGLVELELGFEKQT